MLKKTSSPTSVQFVLSSLPHPHQLVVWCVFAYIKNTNKWSSLKTQKVNAVFPVLQLTFFSPPFIIYICIYI